MKIKPVPKPSKRIYDTQEFKEMVNDESALQRQCEQYLTHFPDIAVIRIPDHAYRAIFANKQLSYRIKGLISSFLKGLPDLLLLKAMNGKYCSAMCVELKTKKGKLTQGQKHFAEKIPVIVCRSFEQFEKEFEEWLK